MTRREGILNVESWLDEEQAVLAQGGAEATVSGRGDLNTIMGWVGWLVTWKNDMEKAAGRYASVNGMQGLALPVDARVRARWGSGKG